MAQSSDKWLHHSGRVAHIFRNGGVFESEYPIILVMACGINKILDPVIQKAFDAGRILFVSPFTDEFVFPNRERAKTRNQLVIDLADEVMIGYASKGGMIEQLSKNIKGKPIEKPQIKGISPNLKRFIASIALKCREDEDEAEYR